jgi:MFS family permease
MILTRRWTTFDALRHSSFRWLWLGGLAASGTFQIGTVAQGWLVYELTGSAFALGWVGSGWSISSLLLSLYGGAITDRVARRDLLVWTRLAMTLNTLALAALISIGAIQIWHLVLSSLLSGVLYSFMMPASQAILYDLVDRETLLNAVSLNSVGMGLMGVVGATLAGYLTQVLGVAGAYYVMAGFYLIAVLSLIRIPRIEPEAYARPSVWSDLQEGVRYIGAQSVLLALLGLATVRIVLAMPYRTLMPKFAQDVMGMDASGLGMLMAAPGLGGVVSSLITASLGDFKGKGNLLLLSGIAMGGTLLLFSSTSALAPVLLFLILVGGASNACMVATNALLQIHCDDQLRGRVMSVYMMVWGLTPLGAIPAGAIADRFGVSLALGLEGGLLGLAFLAVGLLWPMVRRLE